MSNRYKNLFSLPEDLYTVDSPVVIAAGALLKDTQTGRMIAQLKIRNISAGTIKAAKVCVIPFDTIGAPLGAPVIYQYLDLNAGRDCDFGPKSAILLPDPAVRAYAAAVTEVIFTDNSVWTCGDSPWESLAQPAPLGNALGDQELAKQYQIQYGQQAKYFPADEKDLWHCACGAVNRRGEESCHRCRLTHTALEQFDRDTLRADCDARLAAEAQEIAAQQAAAKARNKKIRKAALIAAPIIAVLVIAACVLSAVISDRIKAEQEEAARLQAYESAVMLLESQQYSEAAAIFAELGDYKDSPDQLSCARKGEQYIYAVSLLDEGQQFHEEARDLFQELGDFQDSASYLADFVERPVTVRRSDGSQTVNYHYRYNEKGLPVAINDTAYTWNFTNNIRTYKDGKYEIEEHFMGNGELSERLIRKIGQSSSIFDSGFFYSYDQDGTLVLTERCYQNTGSLRSLYYETITTFTDYDTSRIESAKRTFESDRLKGYDYSDVTTIEYRFHSDGQISTVVAERWSPYISGNALFKYVYEYTYGWVYAPEAVSLDPNCGLPGLD